MAAAAAAAGGPANDGLKEMLQSAVQSVQWTYIIFWRFCHDKRVLEWCDGYYNGAIKTRKTVQPMEVTTEEAALSRSEQLRELYDSLASGEQQVAVRRPSVALSPEDLTEAEWFYLMCVSFSFAPGVGLVGEAYAKQQDLWLNGANEVDSKVFTRAILAKSAYIQTVICIPLLNGVIELGTTEKVEVTNEFIQHVKLFFVIGNDNLIHPPSKPALSSHSSNTTFSSYQTPESIKLPDNTYSMDEDGDDEEEDEGEDVGYDENVPDFMKEPCHISNFQKPHNNKDSMVSITDTDELLQIGMSPDMKFGSPHDDSNNLDSHFNLLATSLDDSCRAESTPGWSDNFELHNPSNIRLHTSAELAPVDSRYSHTVSSILHSQSTRWSMSMSTSHSHHNSSYSTQSSFTTWTPNIQHSHHLPTTTTTTSQRIVKYILFTVPFLHTTTTVDAAESVASRLRKTTSHEELSANHVLAERRRREKLNERFIILRTLVPLVTKMDKASILGDTIEYVKQLRKRIQDLEAKCRLDDNVKVADKRKVRVVETGKTAVAVAVAVQVEVSIIENDALVEMQCRHRDGLLLDVMKRLRELGVEITTVQSSVDAGMFSAEMRAKVKVRKSNNGKKLSITQVKKAIDQIISPL
ncbi:basic helix-loop-helix protein A-like [Bidens hawaiensis]|uniref:basic helix-loop-helix protein A-like n=1 Tax=Bidens hawaiensis TaxID=980011 RepID=UPI004049DBAE